MKFGKKEAWGLVERSPLDQLIDEQVYIMSRVEGRRLCYFDE